MSDLKDRFDKIKKELLIGGRGDGLTLRDIAKKHNVELSHIQAQFKMGLEVEKEHSTDVKIRGEIARDHLTEDPDYYTKLAKMEASK